MQVPPRLRLEMVPSHIVAPTVIVAGRVVGIREKWRRSCWGLPESAAETGAVSALFVSGASVGGTGETESCFWSALKGNWGATGRRKMIRRGPCIGTDTSNVPPSWRTSVSDSRMSIDGGEVIGDSGD